MLFNSYQFIFLYMPIVLVGFYLISRKSHRGAIIWLILASVFFYAYWSLYALPILALSIFLNYWFGLKISNPQIKHRQALLFLAIAINLLALGYFKYANFFIANTNDLRILLGMDSINSLDIVLPIGISFFTFTQIAFLIDNYQDLAQEQNIFHYILFVTFFPHLLAGPLIHHKQMMPQFSDPKYFIFSKEKFSLGIAIFGIGLIKKVLLADSLSSFVEGFFNSMLQNNLPNFWTSWLGSLGYTLQLYFDFSGYSDMAVGLGLLFGITLPFNFNSPLKATSIIDFWQRWHITLTNYVGQYLYTPITLSFMRLGQGKHVIVKTTFSLVIPTILIFLIMGLWHGANWTFVVFGGMHGLYIVINHLWRKIFPPSKNKMNIPHQKIKNLSGWALTFLSVNFANVMFRSETVSSAIKIYEGMLGYNGFHIDNQIEWFWSLKVIILVILAAFPIIFLLPNTLRIANEPKKYMPINSKFTYPFILIMIAGIGLLSIINSSHESTFLYFQF